MNAPPCRVVPNSELYPLARERKPANGWSSPCGRSQQVGLGKTLAGSVTDKEKVSIVAPQNVASSLALAGRTDEVFD